MPSLTRWVKAQRFRAPANALAPPANQRAGKGSPLRYVNRRAWESRLETPRRRLSAHARRTAREASSCRSQPAQRCREPASPSRQSGAREARPAPPCPDAQAARPASFRSPPPPARGREPRLAPGERKPTFPPRPNATRSHHRSVLTRLAAASGPGQAPGCRIPAWRAAIAFGPGLQPRLKGCRAMSRSPPDVASRASPRRIVRAKSLHLRRTTGPEGALNQCASRLGACLDAPFLATRGPFRYWIASSRSGDDDPRGRPYLRGVGSVACQPGSLSTRARAGNRNQRLRGSVG